jgi:hypothetical protein
MRLDQLLACTDRVEGTHLYLVKPNMVVMLTTFKRTEIVAVKVVGNGIIAMEDNKGDSWQYREHFLDQLDLKSFTLDEPPTNESQVPSSSELRTAVQEPVDDIVGVLKRAMDSANVPAHCRAETIGFFCNEYNAALLRAPASSAAPGATPEGMK